MVTKEASESGNYHIPVLLQETIDALNIKPDGVYVDCTFGGGGHSSAILSKLSSEGRLYAFDQDADAKHNLPSDSRLTFIPHNFRHLKRFLRLHNAIPVDGILADLGISSHQIDVPERGFSTRFDADLDMRMDVSTEKTAADILNTYSAVQLQKVLEQYGSVTNAKTLATFITQSRLSKPYTTVQDLKQNIYAYVKGNPNKYLAQVFQALRMEVNEEEKVLAEMLEQTISCLGEGGRLVMITFHSVEDRLVKNFLKSGKVTETEEPEDMYGKKKDSPFTILTKKPLVASTEEQKNNPRSRSAKLRVAEKK